jgi:hypothetical protein
VRLPVRPLDQALRRTTRNARGPPARRRAVVRSNAATPNHHADDVTDPDPGSIVPRPAPNRSATVAVRWHINRQRNRTGRDHGHRRRLWSGLRGLRNLSRSLCGLDVLRRLGRRGRLVFWSVASHPGRDASRLRRPLDVFSSPPLLQLGDELHWPCSGLSGELNGAGRSLKVALEIIRHRWLGVATTGHGYSRQHRNAHVRFHWRPSCRKRVAIPMPNLRAEAKHVAGHDGIGLRRDPEVASVRG